MAIEVELPREIELSMIANKELDVLVRRRIARDILETIKDDIHWSSVRDIYDNYYVFLSLLYLTQF